jgi:hypothetical protein
MLTFVLYKIRKMAKKSKSYSTFIAEDIRSLGIETIVQGHDWTALQQIVPSDWLALTLEKNMRLPLMSEKAKSEFIVAPILTEMHELNPNVFTFFSGSTFDVNKALGLKGRCDFIFSRKPQAATIEAPIFSIIEAKNDGIEDAYPQCIAQLYAADLYNREHSVEFPFIYGAVTTGFVWKFVRYADNVAYIDTALFYKDQLPQLLGALQTTINYYL